MEERAQSFSNLSHHCSAVFGIYVNAVAQKRPRSGKKAPALAPTPPAALPLASTAGNSEWNPRPPLLAICASACFDNSGSLIATFGYPRLCARLSPASGGLVTSKTRHGSLRSLTSDRDAIRTEGGTIGAPSRRIDELRWNKSGPLSPRSSGLTRMQSRAARRWAFQG
jgi:hypothetical protein